jgi:hypothetical protein
MINTLRSIYSAEQLVVAGSLLIVSFSVVYFFGKTLESKIKKINRLKNEVTGLVILIREKEARILSLQSDLTERIIEINSLNRKIDDLNDQDMKRKEQ